MMVSIFYRYTMVLLYRFSSLVPAMVVSDKSYLFVTGNSFSLRPPSFNSPHRWASSNSFSSDLVISPLLRWEYSVDAQSIVLCLRAANDDRRRRTLTHRWVSSGGSKRTTRPDTGDPCDGLVVQRRKCQTNRTPSPVRSSDGSRNEC